MFILLILQIFIPFILQFISFILNVFIPIILQAFILYILEVCIHFIKLTGFHPIHLIGIHPIYSSVYCIPDRRKKSGISFQSLTNLEIVVLTTRRNVNSSIVFLTFIFIFGFVLVSVHLYINRHNFFY